MNRPRRFLLRMVVFLLIVGAAVGMLGDALIDAFLANPPLNGLILGVLALGIVFSFRQVLGLSPAVRWIEAFQADTQESAPPPHPRLLAPMARMLEDRQGKMMLSALATRSLLDSIGSRLGESREISRYMIGLLIFLGLLGTFWGLLDTVGSVGTVIAGLSTDADDLVGTFAALKTNLEAPLSGMGTAFSSSLFGLAGSLVLGFLDLQAGQAQNQFYNDLEEWLSSVTRLSSGTGVADGDQSVPVYVQALLEQTADSLEELQRTLARGEEERRASNARTTQLTERLVALSDQMRTEQDMMVKLAQSHLDMKPVLQRIAEGPGLDGGGMDEATRGHIRNLDVYLARLLEETTNGRTYLASELRAEIKLLGRMMTASAAGWSGDDTPTMQPPPGAPERTQVSSEPASPSAPRARDGGRASSSSPIPPAPRHAAAAPPAPVPQRAPRREPRLHTTDESPPASPVDRPPRPGDGRRER